MIYFYNNQSIIFLWIIPSCGKFVLSSEITYLGKLSFKFLNAPNSLSITFSSANNKQPVYKFFHQSSLQ